MYFWKVDSLVEDFKLGKVSQKEEFKYLLCSTILMVLATNPALYIGSSYNYYDTLGSGLNLGISIFGVFYCYKINSNGDDSDFISRMMCIGFPVIIRVSGMMIPILIVGVIADTLLNPELFNEEVVRTTPIQVAVVSLFLAACYWYLSKKIADVSSRAP